jgi:hypothetical protein
MARVCVDDDIVRVKSDGKRGMIKDTSELRGLGQSAARVAAGG